MIPQNFKAQAEMLQLPGGRTLAAPSWVFPGTIAENCLFLSGKTQEVGLLFFESAPELAYGQEELPPFLSGLPLHWHVHLPSDLNWADTREAASICLKIMEKLNFIGVKRAVLHPPRQANASGKAFVALLERFVVYWKNSGRDSRDILLENLPEHRPGDMLDAAERCETSLCFDLAHYLLSGGAPGKLPDAFMERVRLLHLCAPAPQGQKGHHHPLTALDENGWAAGREACLSAGPDTVFMLELFNWTDFINSLPVLRAWMA